MRVTTNTSNTYREHRSLAFGGLPSESTAGVKGATQHQVSLESPEPHTLHITSNSVYERRHNNKINGVFVPCSYTYSRLIYLQILLSLSQFISISCSTLELLINVYGKRLPRPAEGEGARPGTASHGEIQRGSTCWGLPLGWHGTRGRRSHRCWPKRSLVQRVHECSPPSPSTQTTQTH